MFESLLVLLMTGVVMVVPGGVALSIVGERERLTPPLLQVSQLSAGQVVRGKLMSSMSYVMLLLVAVAPIVALPSLFGGVSLREAAAGLGMVLLTALTRVHLALDLGPGAQHRGAVAGAYALAALIAFLSLGVMAAEIIAFPALRGSVLPGWRRGSTRPGSTPTSGWSRRSGSRSRGTR